MASTNKSGDDMMYSSNPGATMTTTKSRNPQMTVTTSQGSIGTKKTSTSKGVGYAMSPKAMGLMSRDIKTNKTKFGLKGSPKYQ